MTEVQQLREQMDLLRKVHRSLSDLAQRFHGEIAGTEIAAAVVDFARKSLNLERAVLGLGEGSQVRAVAWDGYDDERARTIASLAFGQDHPLFDPVPPGERHRLRTLPAKAEERDAIGRTFELDEYVWLPLREGNAAITGYLIVGNTARRASDHRRLIADDPVVLALENLVDLAVAALRSARLEAELAAERDQLEEHVQERTRDMEEMLADIIETQELRLEELWTPILPIADGVLVMPLIGTMDLARALRFQSTTLEGAAARRAKFVILDVTGVKKVHDSFPGALVGTAKGLRLLGIQTVVTGIRPEVAQRLVELDTQSGLLVTRGTLQSGIAYAMGRSRGPVTQ